MEARSWTQPLPARMAPPDPFLHLRLRQADAWLDESGVWQPVADTPSGVLWATRGYLRWHGPTILASDAEGAGYGDVDPYLASRPLVVAIDAELARRGETGVGEALGMLRVIGAAPWEIPASTRIRRRPATP